MSPAVACRRRSSLASSKCRNLCASLSPGVTYLAFNTLVPRTRDANFRRAVAAAIEERTLLDSVLGVPWRLDAWGVIPPGVPGYQGEDVGYGYDPEAAQAYLQEHMKTANKGPAGLALYPELPVGEGGLRRCDAGSAVRIIQRARGAA
jgi:ABC-type transport system substrate-binding protein